MSTLRQHYSSGERRSKKQTKQYSQRVPVIQVSAPPLPPLHVAPGPHAVDGGAGLVPGVLQVEVGLRPVPGALGPTEQVAEADEDIISW